MNGQILQLDLKPAELRALDMTLEAFQNACTFAMQTGKTIGTTGNALIHKECYQEIRQRFGLSANLSIRAIAYAARALKTNNTLLQPLIEYDTKTLSINNEGTKVSISSICGRLREITFNDGKALIHDAAQYRLVRISPELYELHIKTC